MNRSLTKAFQILLPAVRSNLTGNQSCLLNTSLSLTSVSAGCNGVGACFQVPSRTIGNWVRRHRYVLRARRAKEVFKNPEKKKPVPRYSFAEWNYRAELFALGKRLGEDFDEQLLKEALTDQSYIHKERKKQETLGLDPDLLQLKNNEELHRIGFQSAQNFLNEFVQKEFPLFPKEGHKAIVDHLTSETTVSKVASDLGFKDLILCEEYPPSNETYARAFLALIGALSKSSDEVRTNKFVLDFLAAILYDQDVNEIWDISRPWQMMVEIAKSKNLYPVEPRLIRESGRNTIHAAFVVGIYDKDKVQLGTGIGESLDIAQEMAARDVLKGFFNTRDPRRPFEFQSTNIPYKLIPQVHNIHKSIHK